MRIGNVYLGLLADGSDFAASVEQEGGKAAAQAGTKVGGRLGGGLSQGARRGLDVASTAIGAFVAGGVEQFGDFQQRMNEVFTLLPDITAEQMAKMSDDVKAFSRETGKLPNEVIPALYQAISAGVPPDNVFEFLRTANEGAVAGVAKTEDEVNLLAAVTKGFGDTSKEATQDAADVSQIMVKLGQTTIPELAASYGKAIPLANSLGVSNHQLAASSAALFGVTGNTAEVMTQMKGVFTALIQQNPYLTQGLAKMGYSTSQAAIEALGLQGTLDALVDTTDGNTQALQQMLGSSEAVTAALALTGAQSQTFTDNLAAMEGSAGTVHTAFERMDSGILASGRKMAATAATIAIDVGEKFQAIGPALLALNQGGMLFGVSPARLFGGFFGFVGGRLAPRTAGLLAKGFRGALGGKALSEPIANGLGSALAKVPGSSKFSFATDKLGRFMGSKLGKGLSIGFAAVAVVEVINTYNDIKAGLDEQAQGIADSLHNEIVGGTTESLQQSKAALETGIKQLSDQWYNPFAGGQKDALQQQLDATNAELERRASEAPDALAKRLAEGKVQVDAAAADMVSGIPGAAAAAGAQVPPSVADGVLSQQQAVADAFDTLKNLMKNALKPSAQIARDIGFLTSKRLAKGLNDSRPEVRAEAQHVQALAEQELAQLIEGGGKAGKKAMAELEKGLKSKNPDVRAAAERVKAIIAGKLDSTATPAGDAGESAGQSFAHGVQRGANSVPISITVDGRINFGRYQGKKIPGAAEGDTVRKDELRIVGEKGWELFAPTTSGEILSHDRSRELVSAAAEPARTQQPLVGQLIVNNPKPEPASTSTARELRKLALTGSVQ